MSCFFFQVTILVTYKKQQSITEEFAKNELGDHGMRIDVVDKQGEESDIVILCLVRSDNEQHKMGYINVGSVIYWLSYSEFYYH